MLFRKECGFKSRLRHKIIKTPQGVFIIFGQEGGTICKSAPASRQTKFANSPSAPARKKTPENSGVFFLSLVALVSRRSLVDCIANAVNAKRVG